VHDRSRHAQFFGDRRNRDRCDSLPDRDREGGVEDLRPATFRTQVRGSRTIQSYTHEGKCYITEGSVR
jgi:hypothetical protein